MFRLAIMFIFLAAPYFAMAQSRVDNLCIGRCTGNLTEDDLYPRDKFSGTIPNFSFSTVNMAVYTKIFSNSEILFADRIYDNKLKRWVHRYDLLVKNTIEGKPVLNFAVCEFLFTTDHWGLVDASCKLWEGEPGYGIATMLEKNFFE